MLALRGLPSGTIGSPDRERLDTCFAAFPYEGPVRQLVQALKYRGAVATARIMAELIVERAPPEMLTGALLIPAPAHPARRRARGFNQAALIAREIAAATGVTVCDCLHRDNIRPPQATLSRAERLLLPAGSISVKHSRNGNPEHVFLTDLPAKVVLLDDVTTTGVTLDVCASAIRERYPAGQRPGYRIAIGALTFAGTSAHPAEIK